MARIPNDPTIHVGLRLYDGTDYDTVVEQVAYGGFGVIAFGPNRLNPERQPMLAYKTLRRDLLDSPDTKREFVRECLLWIGLWDHPNIAQAYAVMEMGDATGLRPFIALAYAEQGSLRDLFRAAQHSQPGGRLPLDIGLYLAQQIAAGLAYLHQPDPAYLRTEPTVHRDLKPENVLLTEGRAVITDFGLAKAVAVSPVALAVILSQEIRVGDEEMVSLTEGQTAHTTGLQTAFGMALGTRQYMPAEQWQDAREAKTPVDVYAFGIMLSELLAGRHALLDLDRPYSQAAWRQAHLDPHPRPLRVIEPQIPARVEELYQRCLSLDPAARPSAAEALAELQAGAREAGLKVYTPQEIALHTLHNEFAHWHMWSIACKSFGRHEEALARNERALELARQLVSTEPNLLPDTLNTRGNILVGLGELALEQAAQERERGDALAARKAERDAAAWDEQAKVAYQDALAAYPPETTPEGRRRRAIVWNQLGVFHDQRQRRAAAEAAYGRALALHADKADTYYNRAGNLSQWAISEAIAGEGVSAVAHLRQARVHAITSRALGFSPAGALLERIETVLTEVERTQRP